jgi:integrase
MTGIAYRPLGPITSYLWHLSRLPRPIAARTGRPHSAEFARHPRPGRAMDSDGTRGEQRPRAGKRAPADPRLRRGRPESGSKPNREASSRARARARPPICRRVLALAERLSDKYRLPFVLLEQTAMRIGELMSLERDDVDAAGSRFRIKAVNRKGRRGSRKARFVPCRAGSWRSPPRRCPFAAACSPT